MGGYVPKDAGERGWEGMSLRMQEKEDGRVCP